MTIKEIIKTTATLLNREDLKKYVNGQSYSAESDTAKAIERLIELANLVINELSLSFVPMVKSESVNANSEKVYYSSLNENAISVLEVLDAFGNSIDFTQSGEYFETVGYAKTVKYSFVPKKYSIDESIGYSEKDVSLRILAYGLSAEFCLTEGEFDLAVLFHDKYVESIKEICLPKNRISKKRSWR